MMMGTQQPLQLLYNEARLESLLQALDELHTAASEGRLNTLTSLNRTELAGWLRELTYTAQETIAEMEGHSADAPGLWLVK